MGTSCAKQSNETNAATGPKIKLVRKQGLSEKDLDFLAKQTNLSKQELDAWFLEFKSRNPRLELSKEDFTKVYGLMRPNDPPYLIENISKYAFRAFDADNNGSISFSEFLVAYAMLTQGDLGTKLSYCFEMYDADNNELIDKSELVPVIEGMYVLLNGKIQSPPPADQLADEIIKRGDYSKDGQISKQEFIDLLTSEPAFQVLLNPFADLKQESSTSTATPATTRT